MTRKKIISTLKANLDRFHDDYGVSRMGLFGSFASGTASSKSDVDLFVEFDRPIGFRFVQFSDQLEKMLGRKVDVLTPAGIKSIRSKALMHTIKRSIQIILA